MQTIQRLVEDKELLLERATLCGEWMLRNQVTDRYDANRGRVIDQFDRKTGFLYRTANWTTGITCMSFCALYRRTGEERYLDAAILAGRYIMSLQVMDKSDPRYFGTMREITPQSIEFCPRDATTAAWALVWLYNTCGEKIYLDRATLFGEWHMERGMHDGWPLYSCFMDDEMEDFLAKGSFQSGTGLFYHDLFMATKDVRFIERGFRPIAKIYRDYFVQESGRIIQKRDAFTREVIQKGIKGLEPDIEMHEFNDDFGGAMLQTAAELFKDESYREAALRYARWLMKTQDKDGRFAEGKVPSGVPTALMYYHDLGRFYNDHELLEARDKTVNVMLADQNLNTGHPYLDGGFRGRREDHVLKLPEIREEKHGHVNIRTSAYALMALLKLESDLPEIWLGRKNRKWQDPLLEEKQYRFKW